jgi:hypothetical protein
MRKSWCVAAKCGRMHRKRLPEATALMARCPQSVGQFKMELVWAGGRYGCVQRRLDRRAVTHRQAGNLFRIESAAFCLRIGNALRDAHYLILRCVVGEEGLHGEPSLRIGPGRRRAGLRPNEQHIGVIDRFSAVGDITRDCHARRAGVSAAGSQNHARGENCRHRNCRENRGPLSLWERVRVRAEPQRDAASSRRVVAKALAPCPSSKERGDESVENMFHRS